MRFEPYRRVDLWKSWLAGAFIQLLPVLAGGERSYINVAFTLAVGEVASSPVRIMDEFDVFMDGAPLRIDRSLACTGRVDTITSQSWMLMILASSLLNGCHASAANNRQMTMAALFSFAYLNKDMQMVLISPQVRTLLLFRPLVGWLHVPTNLCRAHQAVQPCSLT